VGLSRRKKYFGLNRWWLRYEYKHTTIAILGITIFVILLDGAVLNGLFQFIERLDYLGGLIAGLLLASFFTAAPAIVLVVHLAQNNLDPLILAVLIGLGSALADLFLILFFEERIYHELVPVFRRLRFKWAGRKRPRRRRKMSAPLLLLGSFIIMTPLPDEVGIGLLGISRFPQIFIFIICLALNTLGAALTILTVRGFLS
jgi:hypothetical protein